MKAVLLRILQEIMATAVEAAGVMQAKTGIAEEG